MDKEITVQKKTLYGRDVIYPVGEPAVLFTKLLRKKTLNNDDLTILKQDGYKVIDIETGKEFENAKGE